MQTIELDIAKYKTREELMNFLKRRDVRKGDTVKVVTDEDKTTLAATGIVVIVLLAIIYIFSQRKKSDRELEGEAILDKLVKGKSIDEIEKEVKDEYGVKIEVEQKKDEEREDWIKLSMKGLDKGYAKDDPDISSIPVREPNPKYNPWKKGAQSRLPLRRLTEKSSIAPESH